MASKRPAEGEASGAQPPFKKVQFEAFRIGPVSTLEEMDMKVLQFKNKKLAQRLEQRQRTEAELRQRIEQLEKRQTQDDAVLNVVNRYWNQLNEDIRVLLQRFDAETADESENKNENEATTSFLMQLSSWDKEELDEKLANRVQVSKRAVAKVIQAFDRLMQRNEKITMALKGELEGEDVPSLDEQIRQTNIELQAENMRLQALHTQLHEKYHALSLKAAEHQDMITGKETEAAELRNQVEELQYDHSKVQQQNYKLEHHLAEALEKIKNIEHTIEEEKQPVKTVSSVSQKKLDEIQKECEEQRELANNRLQELDRLHQQHRDALKEVEKLKMDIRQLPESVIVETTEYKCLQSQFSVLYNESMQLKTLLDDARQQLQNSKNAHLRQIEQMELDELAAQKKLRTELIQHEDMLAQVRKEYEMLRIEFETNVAANEQTGPINREMRHLITSLQSHNTQLKTESARYKRKFKDTTTEIAKLKKEVEDLQAKQPVPTEVKETNNAEAQVKEESPSTPVTPAPVVQIKEEPVVPKENEEEAEMDEEGDAASTGSDKEKAGPSNVKKEVKKEKGSTPTPAASTTPPSTEVKKEIKTEKDAKDPKAKEVKNAESEIVRDLKAQIKKALNDQKEMKLLLDMYKGVSKDQRDKVQLMAAEKKARAEVDDLRMQMKKMQYYQLQENKREERKRMADDDAMRKIKQLEDQIGGLQKQVASHKQVDASWKLNRTNHHLRQAEEEALLNEMEVTGQAYEDMQEQNSRLIQQLREKDDANFKLMSERIKSNQLHKLAREEKQVLNDQVATLSNHVDAQTQVLRKLEEKERFMQNSLATAEKELNLRQQAMEMHKRKAIESAQSAADLKLHLEKYHAQMKEAQQVVAEKTAALEAEAYKTKRLQEEIAQLRRKVERMKKIEMAGTADEVMMEEIREYKETLTCPSCKVKRKDAVLSKCFHVFCYDCLRTRYETRQRKCPKCNAAFGANDYHRLYLCT
ncbi:E3 ubiquitin-protein ligase Bre1 isoform X2 [Neocloeon triangulifer]|uniref:E3 ubiquitin-protein ligase Bre1 isoform X2 n=1 Tax=Neocloeon triangulifer TaxID=2078957 RepID=UPI00286F73DB|nr:E3 ubiquitin-protein ligase Bre1 isoform X2 [Neocloeon triangulifer]